ARHATEPALFWRLLGRSLRCGAFHLDRQHEHRDGCAAGDESCRITKLRRPVRQGADRRRGRRRHFRFGALRASYQRRARHARIVTGYKGSADVLLAMEKGEVNGTFVGGWTGLRQKASPWLATGEAKLLVQLAVRPDPTFRDVPVILDYAHDERQRQVLQLA